MPKVPQTQKDPKYKSPRVTTMYAFWNVGHTIPAPLISPILDASRAGCRGADAAHWLRRRDVRPQRTHCQATKHQIMNSM
eukprot:1922590-Amphidinium_carterae.2